MDKRFLFILLAGMSTFFNCGSSSQLIPEPIQNGNLIIGSLIFEIDGYQDQVAVIRRNIEVAIIGQVMVDGKMKSFSQWTTTDDDGYFYIPNVPTGQFAIKGFRTHLIGLGDLIIARELIDPRRNYFEIKRADVLAMTGQLFDVSPRNQIVNFDHNIVTLYRNGIVDHLQRHWLENVKLVTGELLNSPSVARYFLEKFPTSAWANFLRLQLE
ncbi:MAG: carboxypeptidase-like regulatory domain-containing protein [candidate division KSB1 bacterium]|nr:carboxypeptidase-like regulatory domain-containing protein [candidate division KSB1 bacterium]MDZ7358825.1 carboxypeptidase-like regulatory domain-containing protein [candidate division KSB1 bacterium]MDZ7399347.1 carboxypeptidase-like regulatory domain-containing protein [candidate division KSB1 bacterium]